MVIMVMVIVMVMRIMVMVMVVVMVMVIVMVIVMVTRLVGDYLATFAKTAKTAKIVPSAIRPCDYSNGDGVGDDNGDHCDGNSDGATSRGLNRAGRKHFARALRMCTHVLRSKHIEKRNSLVQNLFLFAFRR